MANPLRGRSRANGRGLRGGTWEIGKKKRAIEGGRGEGEREREKETDSAPVFAVGLADRIGFAADRRRAAADATKPFDVFDAFRRHNSG